MTGSAWRRCSSCKSAIAFEKIYWVCNVSTCNRKRAGLLFCSVPCWEVHLPMMRHRESWAVEKCAPSRAAWEQEQAEDGETEGANARPLRKKVAVPAPIATPRGGGTPRDILIVASKLKKYIRAQSGMNTSDAVLAVLSDHVRRLCDEAIRAAASDGRKTVMDRDVRAP